MAEPKEDNIFDEVSETAPDAEEKDISLAPQPEGLDAEVTLDDDAPHPGVDALVEERDQLKDRLLRAMAEAENARKRGERDRREAEQFGGTKLARDMLPVYDNLRRALDAGADKDTEIGETEKAVIEGVELTLRELLNIFSKHGITLLAPEKGETFDPQVHQAMFEAPIPDVPKGCVIQVMTEGFMLHDRLLRPAQVGVSSTV